MAQGQNDMVVSFEQRFAFRLPQKDNDQPMHASHRQRTFVFHMDYVCSLFAIRAVAQTIALALQRICEEYVFHHLTSAGAHNIDWRVSRMMTRSTVLPQFLAPPPISKCLESTTVVRKTDAYGNIIRVLLGKTSGSKIKGGQAIHRTLGIFAFILKYMLWSTTCNSELAV